jgi:hypothetical protein
MKNVIVFLEPIRIGTVIISPRYFSYTLDRLINFQINILFNWGFSEDLKTDQSYHS